MKDAINKNNIVLTGFMGTGKTAVGMIIASELSRTLFDTDQIIEEENGCTISQIFAEKGEAYFRDQESAVIARLRKFPSGSLVIATGGGTVLRKENMDLLSENGIIVLLTASPAAILRRVSRTDQRPLMAGPVTVDMIKAKLRERERFYSNYSFRIDTTGLTTKQVARKIIVYLNSF